MTSISEKVIEKIKEQKVNPKPRWYFLLKNYSILALFISSIICGALAVSTIIFMVGDYDRDIAQYLSRSNFTDILVSIPYFWIAILLLFILAAHFEFKKLYTGYRYEIYKIFLISFGLSIIIGTGLFYGGLDNQVDVFFSQKVPFYENLVYNKDDIWEYPERGLLGGCVIEVGENNSFSFLDFRGRLWKINEILKGNNNFPQIQKGLCLRLIGEEINDNTFNADTIRLWNRNGR